ncbi:MAG TPA: hypothetical protein PKY10_14225, partial [Lentisphaeria bacterium]|nr:hypothetical protein [Lentisphaeria bacterium]
GALPGRLPAQSLRQISLSITRFLTITKFLYMVVVRRDKIACGFAIWPIGFLTIQPGQSDGAEKRFKSPPAWPE